MKLDLLLCSSALLLAACAGGSEFGSTDDFVDEDLPAGNCDTDCTTSGEGVSPVGGPCKNTNNCMGDAVCVAPFDGEVGDFTCSADCIEFNDDTRWCSDATACCGANAICTPRGYCVPGGSLEGTGADSSTGDLDTTATTGASTETGASMATGDTDGRMTSTSSDTGDTGGTSSTGGMR